MLVRFRKMIPVAARAGHRSSSQSKNGNLNDGCNAYIFLAYMTRPLNLRTCKIK
jgi:hypothetical protein